MLAHELTAAAAARLIRRKRLSPLELVDALLARIGATEGRVRAWTVVDEKGARRAARKLADAAARGRFLGPLHGVPIAVKDIYYTKGVATEGGSKLHRGLVPSFDAAVVARLKGAGAIVLGKTHTTELANSDPAPTRNPWNLRHTPGGSSSGSAAAVAAGMAPASLGSQTGGSNLRPASYCGIAGLKPSFGRVSLHGVMPLSWSLDHAGFMARSVEDLALLLQACAGHDPRDATSSPEPVADYVSPLGRRRRPRIGLVREFFFDIADADVARVTDDAVKRLRAAGARVREVLLPDSFAVIHAAQFVCGQPEIADAYAHRHRKNPRLFRPLMRESIEIGALVPADLFVRAQRIRRQFRREITARLRPFDVLAMPTTRTPALPTLKDIGDWTFQSPWSACGLPSLTVPCGLADNGLPLGLQLVAAPFAEAALLGAGAWCERVLGRFPPPPL